MRRNSTSRRGSWFSRRESVSEEQRFAEFITSLLHVQSRAAAVMEENAEEMERGICRINGVLDRVKEYADVIREREAAWEQEQEVLRQDADSVLQERALVYSETEQHARARQEYQQAIVNERAAQEQIQKVLDETSSKLLKAESQMKLYNEEMEQCAVSISAQKESLNHLAEAQRCLQKKINSVEYENGRLFRQAMHAVHLKRGFVAFYHESIASPPSLCRIQLAPRPYSLMLTMAQRSEQDAVSVPLDQVDDIRVFPPSHTRHLEAIVYSKSVFTLAFHSKQDRNSFVLGIKEVCVLEDKACPSLFIGARLWLHAKEALRRKYLNPTEAHLRSLVKAARESVSQNIASKRTCFGEPHHEDTLERAP